MAVMEEVSHVDDVNRPTDTQSELGGAGKGAHPDDNILLAQGHAPILKRSFNFLGTLGLGFRYGTITHPISSHFFSDRGMFAVLRTPGCRTRAVSGRACSMEGRKLPSLASLSHVQFSGSSLSVSRRRLPRFRRLEVRCFVQSTIPLANTWWKRPVPLHLHRHARETQAPRSLLRRRPQYYRMVGHHLLRHLQQCAIHHWHGTIRAPELPARTVAFIPAIPRRHLDIA